MGSVGQRARRGVLYELDSDSDEKLMKKPAAKRNSRKGSRVSRARQGQVCRGEGQGEAGAAAQGEAAQVRGEGQGGGRQAELMCRGLGSAGLLFLESFRAQVLRRKVHGRCMDGAWMVLLRKGKDN